ncbi:MAG: DUF4317 domain-containing protein [Oscillospiraceae bacterium]|nr:DUF4317 domain-containing protein [Oscillospiraceae bacterium]
MKSKEIAAIRRRLRAEKNNIRSLYGCYVNEKGEIISQLEEAVSLLALDEAEKYFSLLRKTLSGRLGKTVLPIEFSADYVRSDENFRLLMDLRNSHLEDPALRSALFEKIIASHPVEEGNYVILLASDSYDIPPKDEELESGGVFRYLLCCVCPVKETKAALSYTAKDHRFSDTGSQSVLAAPQLGFLWPALEDGGANLYSAVTCAAGSCYEDFIKGVFDCGRPSLPEEQKQLFGEALRCAMGKTPSFDDALAVNEQLNNRIAAEQEENGKEPVSLTPEELCDVIERRVEMPEAEAFCETCREILGENAAFNLENLCSTKTSTIELPGVKITFTAEARNLIRSEVLDGRKVLLVEVHDGLRFDGSDVVIR